MLIDDGVLKRLNVEDSPGKADLSGAAHLLSQM
jgi:peroxiredoxin